MENKNDMTNKKKIIDSEEFNVVFGGKSSIDAKLFSTSIGIIERLIKESGKITGLDSSYRLEIKANKEGSFDICLNLIAESLLLLGPIANETLSLIIEWIQYKKIKVNIEQSSQDSDNKPTTDISNNSIIGNMFSNRCVVNYNSIVDKSITNFFINAGKNDRESVLWKSKNASADIPRSEFEVMATPVVDISTEPKKIKTKLRIRKPDLLKDSKWWFEFKGDLIEAAVKDRDFLEKIHNRSVIFSAGMQINCWLKIEDKINRGGEITHGYTVLRVLKVIYKPSQDKLF